MSKVTTTFEAVDTGMVATIQKIERETKSMKDTTEKAEKSISFSFGAMAKAGAGLALGIGVVKGAFAAVTGMINDFGQALDLGGRLSDLSERTGETSGNLLLLERAFDNSGIGADKVGTAINKLQKFMSDANSGTEKNIEALNELGLSYSILAELSPTEQMGLLADRIKSIESPTERAAMAMKIFGKSGGELLPLLQNFSGEIGNAKDELGSMTGIMDAKSGVFDTISDKITIIKGKFMEFAAGILDKVTPALELFTTILARIDAAKLGQNLADAFLGGQKAMEGFGAALDMLKIGEFGLSWKIIFKSIELQLKEIFNQIYKIAVSTFEGIKGFIISILGPGSALLNIIASSFEFIATKMLVIITKGLSTILNEIPGVSDSLVESLKLFERGADVAANKVKNGLKDIIPQAKDAGQAFGDTFEASMETTKPLINTLNTAFELNQLKAKASIKLAKEAAGILSFNMTEDIQKKNFLGIQEVKDELKKLGEMKPDPLKKMKDNAKLLFKDMGNIVDKVKELTNIEKLTLELKEAKSGKGTKEEEQRVKELIGARKFKEAERAIEKVKQKSIDDEIRINKEGELDRRSIADIAKEEGIKTLGKSNEQLRKEILEKRRQKPPEEQKKEDEKKGKEGKKEPEKKEDPLFEMVKAIKDLVAKIEPKLPTHALAL
jgi:hypothetical protein